MERLHHPNIIRLYEVVETLAKMHIVMEYAGGGELFNKISNDGKFTELEAKSIMAQVVAGVSHMVGDLIYNFVTGVTTWQVCLIEVWFLVFNATFNNISVMSWRSDLLVEETEENH